MADDLTIRFFGMCAFAELRAGHFVYLPTVMDHRPVLITKAKRIVTLKTSTSWPPDFIFYDASGVQMVGWSLTGKEVKFKAGVNRPAWTDRTNFLDLADFHGKATLPAGTAARFQLHNGGLSTAGSKTNKYDVLYPGKDRKDVPLAEVVEWTATGNGSILESAAGEIRFVDSGTVSTPTIVTVTNVAAEPGATGDNHHFGHYYDHIDPQPGQKVTLVNLDVEVYDCVPPVDLPDETP